MFDYDELASKAVKILDTYNLKQKLLKCRGLDPYDTRNYIQCSTNDADLITALECLSSYELMEYLTDRYGVRWTETISYNMVIE